MSDVIFSTIHGSRLYGLSHEGSDYDYFTVTNGNERPRQGVVDGIDTTRMGLSAFLALAHSGSHQSVEALFSREKQWGSVGHMYAPMLSQMRICGPEVTAKYMRTITKFCYGDFKRRRHAVRLRLNLTEIMNTGRVSRVTMSAVSARLATSVAEKLEGDALKEFLMKDKPEVWR